MNLSHFNFNCWPHFDDEDIDAVTRVLRSGRVNQWTGHEVTKFQEEYADHIGVDYAVALANGSVALDLAMKVLGIGDGDEVVVTPRTFIASASCVSLANARPVFADVDRESQNITLKEIEKVVTSKTKSIIAVHHAGWPCEMDALRSFCDAQGIYLIEDCAQAHGALYRNRPVGSFGDIAIFSFCQDKILTTGGEGGLLVTNSKDLWQKAWSFKDHGKDHNIMLNPRSSGGFNWAIKIFGTNYRMTEMQAAIGRVALRKLSGWVKKRRHFAGLLNSALIDIPAIRITEPPSHVYHSYYKYYAFLKGEALKDGWNRDRIVQKIRDNNIPCSAGSCPELYLEEAFQASHRNISRLPIAKNLGETSMMFMVHPTLDEEHIFYLVENIKEVINQAAI
jgi:dTDP-4-amino-4,6-dideoxygalactose transaminase